MLNGVSHPKGANFWNGLKPATHFAACEQSCGLPDGDLQEAEFALKSDRNTRGGHLPPLRKKSAPP
ncbi:MAG: hypothetical protein ACJLUP_22200 [Agrobacterium tumefaciens]